MDSTKVLIGAGTILAVVFFMGVFPAVAVAVTAIVIVALFLLAS